MTQEATSQPASPTLGYAVTPTSTSPPMFTVRQIANYLQVSRATIRRLMMAGQIPYTRVGSQIRFDPIAVRGALDRHR